MPRRRSGFGGRRRAAPPRRSPSSSTGGTTNKPAPRQPPAPAAAPVPQRGGFMRNVAEIGTGIALGHVAAHAIESMFFGGKDASPEEIKEVESKLKSGPCAAQYEGFVACLENNTDEPARCQWAFDLMGQCQTNNKLTLVEHEYSEGSYVGRSPEGYMRA